VPVVDELTPLKDDHLEVAVIAPREVGLDNRTGACRGGRDHLPPRPRQVDIRVVVPVVDELTPLKDDHLEVAVIAPREVGLDDATRPRRGGRDHLPPRPRQVDIRVVVPPVP
jgi:hypothetical protein